LHVWVDRESGTPYHIFYQAKGTLTGAEGAELLRDDQHPPGLERVLLRPPAPNLKCAVHRYAGAGDIASARVAVRAFFGLMAVELHPPLGEGSWWHVGEFVSSTQTFRVTNLLSNVSPE
jgi:hypothetical protein